MKRHKTWIVPLLALAALTIVVSVTLGAAPAVGPAQPAAAGTEAAPALRPTVMASADFAVVYTSVGQLKKAADLVVRGEVTNVSYMDFNSSAYTEITFRVSECLKGDVGAGKEVTIVEVGGVTSMATVKGDKFGAPTALDAKTEVTVLLDGAPLSEVGDKCVYFLGTGSIGVVPGSYYVPLGAFQGRFKIDNGVAERFVPDDWQEGEYTALPVVESAIDQTVLKAEVE